MENITVFGLSKINPFLPERVGRALGDGKTIQERGYGMERIIWTPEQAAELAGYYPGCDIVTLSELEPELFGMLSQCPADEADIEKLCEALWMRFGDPKEWIAMVLPIGSPAFMFKFSRYAYIQKMFMDFLFAHSTRESVDEPQPDGSVKKVSVFRHQKFITL